MQHPVDLPPEIEREILEHAAYQCNSKAAQLKLMLLSWTVYNWLAPIFYRVIILDSHQGRRATQDLISLVHSKPPKFFCRKVKGLYINRSFESLEEYQSFSKLIPTFFSGVTHARFLPSYYQNGFLMNGSPDPILSLKITHLKESWFALKAALPQTTNSSSVPATSNTTAAITPCSRKKGVAFQTVTHLTLLVGRLNDDTLHTTIQEFTSLRYLSLTCHILDARISFNIVNHLVSHLAHLRVIILDCFVTYQLQLLNNLLKWQDYPNVLVRSRPRPNHEIQKFELEVLGLDQDWDEAERIVNCRLQRLAKDQFHESATNTTGFPSSPSSHPPFLSIS